MTGVDWLIVSWTVLCIGLGLAVHDIAVTLVFWAIPMIVYGVVRVRREGRSVFGGGSRKP